MITSTIILAAGLGTRLKPLTDEFPKCLTEINGQPILYQQLAILNKLGFKTVRIVTGYLSNKIIETVGLWQSDFPNLDIWFTNNPNYMTTNTAYSAVLANDILKQGCFVIEGDVVFSEDIIRKALDIPDDKTCWLVSRCKKEDNGAIIQADETGKVISLQIIGSAIDNTEGYKSTGIKKIAADYGRKLCEVYELKVLLDETSSSQNKFLDEVMANELRDEPSYILDVSNSFWAEIDCRDDIWRAEKNYPRKKYVVLILDGAADNSLEALGNQTPLTHAYIPNLDRLTSQSQIGLLQTIPIGLPSCSIVAILGLLGYNPTRYYPYGRASLEALANDIYLDEDEIAFRCNIVTIDENNYLLSATPKFTDEIENWINHIPKQNSHLKSRFYRGQEYRNILIVKDSRIKPPDLVLFPPHENIGKKIGELLPRANELAYKLTLFSIASVKIFNGNYYMLWPWSPSVDIKLPSFALRHGLEGSIITAMDFFRGIGIASGLEAKKIPDATGFSDTNLNSKLTYAISALKNKDIVFIHINAPDEESHKKDAEGKVKILERIDSELIEPLYDYMESTYQGRYRLAVLSDHYSFTDTGGHGGQPTPFIVSGFGIKPSGISFFAEPLIERKAKTILKGYEFMGFLTKEAN